MTAILRFHYLPHLCLICRDCALAWGMNFLIESYTYGLLQLPLSIRFLDGSSYLLH